MRPVRVSIDVPQAREDVYDFLDVLANHELFTDHMLRDWRREGPARGVGAKAKVTAVAGGRTEALDMEVIDAERPARTVERNVGASGRVATGTYMLAELPGGGAAIALVPPQGDYQPGRMTGISLGSPDPRADHAELAGKGVDVDAEIMGGDGTVPALFFFRDHDRNTLMIVQEFQG